MNVVAAWLAAAAALLSMTLVSRLYMTQRRATSTPLLRLLISLRVGLILLVAVAMLAPSRAIRKEFREPGTLWLLIDDSASMRRIDRQMTETERHRWAEGLGVPAEKIAGLSRGQLAAVALNSLDNIIERYDVRIVPLSQPRVISPDKGRAVAEAVEMLHNPAGPGTAIGDALRLVGGEAKGDATVLIVSDGRQNSGSDPVAEARRLGERKIPVFALAAGEVAPVRDAAVDSIDTPDSIFVGDEAILRASIRLDGVQPTETVAIELRRDGKAIQQKVIAATRSRLTVEFIDKPDNPGTYQYQISITPVPGEATLENNHQTARVTVNRDKLKVLLIDDQPRWEYQFLRNYLMRDHRFALTSLLLEPARVENVRRPAAPDLPGTRADWSRWDLVILGDVPPERLSSGAQSLLAAALREGEVRGLVMVAGPRNMPLRYVGAPLAELMPVELRGSNWDSDELTSQLRRGFVARPADDSPLARFSTDDDENRELWAALPPWFWHTALTTARPGATVEWEIGDPAEVHLSGESVARRKRALLATMRYGSARVMYLASPQTWRLRYVQQAGGQVSDLHRRFWGQAIRWLCGGSESQNAAASVSAENRNLSANPQLLAAIAKAGNGITVDGADVRSLDAKFPQSSHVHSTSVRVGLFADPRAWQTQFAHWLVFAAFLAMITTEWVMRKRGGLV